MLFFETTTALGINDLVSETLRIAVELKITSRATHFIKQIFFSHVADDQIRRWDMGQCVWGFVYLGGQCLLFPDDQSSEEESHSLTMEYPALLYQTTSFL
jgi:hypothetical protein